MSEKEYEKNFISPAQVVELLRKKKPVEKKNFGVLNKIIALLTVSKNRFSDNYTTRTAVVGAIFALCFIGILVRYAYVSLLPTDFRDKLRSQASRQFDSEVTLAAPRGQIQDRNGRPLAVSVLQPSLLIFPKRIPEDKAVRMKVARQLQMSLSELDEIAKKRKRPFWLKRQMPSKEFEELGDLSKFREFLVVIEEPKRFYPERELAAHLIGFAGVDNEGLDGVERLYNDLLRGDAITAKVARDARGSVTLTTPNGAVKPEPSTAPLRLSIDLSVQSFAEAALREGAIKARAKSASAVVMDVATGELLAIASYPFFDLNSPPDPTSDKRRFHPVMDALELGSVVKPIFIAAALESGAVKKNDLFDCENGKYKVPGKVIRDDHKHGVLNIADIIKYSSNICTYKIVKKMGRQGFYDSIFTSGLGRGPGTGLPGEWQGRVERPHVWREVRFANMTFGQGIAVSPLQMTRALGIIARGGLDAPVRLVLPDEEMKRGVSDVGPKLQFVSPEVSRIILDAMKTVLEEGGTGTRAVVADATVAGKTGTAQKYDPKTRSYSERTASFVGVVPAHAPKLAITVVIDEPQVRPAYGGVLAGPVFAEIGTKTLQYLNANGLFDGETDLFAEGGDNALYH